MNLLTVKRSRLCLKWKHSRAPKPVGSISIVGDGRHKPTRRIKVKMDGPKSRRWMDYARWWWEQNRGPVPEGKRVCHMDGDSLNDDPSNLQLLTPGDVVFLAHERDPEMSRKNYENCRASTGKYNTFRALTRRMRQWLPTCWYPVDFHARVIRNDPRRSERGAYEAAGMTGARTPGDTLHGNQKLRAAALGFPELSFNAACLLAVLIERGEQGLESLFVAVEAFKSRRGWTRAMAHAESFYVPLHELRKAGLIIRRYESRRGPRLYRSTGRAVPTLFPLWIAVRGTYLSTDTFAGFTREQPAEFRPIKKKGVPDAENERAVLSA